VALGAEGCYDLDLDIWVRDAAVERTKQIEEEDVRDEDS
jgi:hypothetical protein